MEFLEPFVIWSDAHSGFLSVILFFITLGVGWVSGLFRFLKQKPNFRASTIEGPSFATIVPQQTKHEDWDTHRVVICLYLSITNIGSSPGSIRSISAAYKFPPTSIGSIFKNRWSYIKETVLLSDLFRQIGSQAKVYPFLNQQSHILASKNKGYLRVGEIERGIVYFEMEQLAFGSHQPIQKNGRTTIKLKIVDAFHRNHITSLSVPFISIQEARLYGSSIGNTFSAMEKSKHND